MPRANVKKVADRVESMCEIAEAGRKAYYRLKQPNPKEDRQLSTLTLKPIAKREKSKNLVIYCEKIWIHPDELRKFEKENNLNIRPMLVPFELK